MRWYVVFTRPSAEGKALTQLENQGYTAYLPLYRTKRRHARREEMVDRPLFPRYLFVALDILEQQWRPILSTVGVADLLRRGDRPTAVPSGLVEALRERESGGYHSEPSGWYPRPGDQVRVVGGPFADVVGSLFRISDKDRVLVLLDLLGREVVTEIPLSRLAVV